VTESRGRNLPSPEAIASILVALVAVVVVATSVLAGRGTVATTPSSSPGPTSNATPSPTMDPAIRNALATALAVNQSLAGRSEELAAAIAVKAPVAVDIADLLRLVNGDVNAGNDAADRLLLDDATADLGVDLDAFYGSVLTRNNETLGTTIRNTRAYVAGAQAVIDLLAGLPALNDRIVDALARRPEPSSVPPSTSPPPSLTPATPSPTPSVSPTPATPSPVMPSASQSPTGLLTNGGFENGLVGWQLQLSDGARASLAHEPGAGPDGSAAARVDIATGSEARSGISLAGAALNLSQGVTYVVELSARSEAVREVRVRLTDGSGQTTAARIFTVGTGWSVLSFESLQLVTDPSAHLSLDLGRSDATVWFDHVVIRESPG
jgi:hypothetical protein